MAPRDIRRPPSGSALGVHVIDHLSQNISLRPIVDSDLDYFFEQARDPAALHMLGSAHRDPNDRAAFDAHWAMNLSDPAILQLTIDVDGAVAGFVCAFFRGENPIKEVGYALGKAFWGKGIATIALTLLLQEVKDRPLCARCIGDNAASIRVLEKCGFVRDHTERSFSSLRGTEVDELIFRLG